jgi:hypothetical protein
MDAAQRRLAAKGKAPIACPVDDKTMTSLSLKNRSGKRKPLSMGTWRKAPAARQRWQATGSIIPKKLTDQTSFRSSPSRERRKTTSRETGCRSAKGQAPGPRVTRGDAPHQLNGSAEAKTAERIKYENRHNEARGNDDHARRAI